VGEDFVVTHLSNSLCSEVRPVLSHSSVFCLSVLSGVNLTIMRLSSLSQRAKRSKEG
jgi:hypothetical protein